jgi:uncharacterized protein RhaS with RHS repeats
VRHLPCCRPCLVAKLVYAHNPTVGVRYYNPVTGRYLNRDFIGYKDGLNNYLYVHNNPINHIDPLGLIDKVVIVVIPKETTPTTTTTPTTPATPAATDTPEPGSRKDTQNFVKELSDTAAKHNALLDKNIESYTKMSDKTFEAVKAKTGFVGSRDDYVKSLQTEHLRIIAVDGALGDVKKATEEHVKAGDNVTVFGHSSQVDGAKDSEFATGQGDVHRGDAQKAVEEAGGKFISCHPNNDSNNQVINVEANGFHASVTSTTEPDAPPAPAPAPQGH